MEDRTANNNQTRVIDLTGSDSEQDVQIIQPRAPHARIASTTITSVPNLPFSHDGLPASSPSNARNNRILDFAPNPPLKALKRRVEDVYAPSRSESRTKAPATATKKRKLENIDRSSIHHSRSGSRSFNDKLLSYSVEAEQTPAITQEKITRVLKGQVFPHIKNCLLKYNTTLSKEQKDWIGQQSAGDLVKDPDFLRDFTNNQYNLSSNYEKQLSTRAEHIVDGYAESLFKPRREVDSPISLRSKSKSSEERVPFDDTLLRSSITRSKSRAYSSSPATSFSAEEGASSKRSTRIISRPVIVVPSSATMSRPTENTPSIEPVASQSTKEEDVQRPYVSVSDREKAGSDSKPLDHIEFRREEVECLCQIVKSFRKAQPAQQSLQSLDPISQLSLLMAGKEKCIGGITTLLRETLKAPGLDLGRQLLRLRGVKGIALFLKDVVGRSANVSAESYARRTALSPALLASLLQNRELSRSGLHGRRGDQDTFHMTIMSHLEDSITHYMEWTGCSGDLSTISWIGESRFICGAIAHSDHYNMQYNKPGNLLLGSLLLEDLRAFPDHRIVRPLVDSGENRENSLASMRQTQDPWLYTSVVSSSYSEFNGFTFTASFDKTVKVWDVAHDGSSMDLAGTWYHENKVNFVVTSEYHERVATAADVSDNAIRVYNFDDDDIENSPYDTYSGLKAQEQANDLRRRDAWAYFPATMQWGKCEVVKNYLLVGYSPRSTSGEDLDIPEDKKNSGELCIWDVENMEAVFLSSAHTQNVFEVMWHPTQAIFIAATSPVGIIDTETRTQIRIFCIQENGNFAAHKTLDCSALDINELTIMPTGGSHDCYITASCTDGKTYVWDTAHGDKAIHALVHGESLDDPLPGVPREISDAGVKFAAWGQGCDRLYTGSSDGKIIAWDIRRRNPFIRIVLEVSGGVQTGSFSKDFSKMLVGDATGKVHLLSFDDSDLQDVEVGADSSSLDIGTSSATWRSKPHVAHDEPLPPIGAPDAVNIIEESNKELADQFISKGQLRFENRYIGVVQGPKYHSTGFFRSDAHEDGDISKPLKAEFQVKQKYEVAEQMKVHKLKLSCLLPVTSSRLSDHLANVKTDRALKQAGVELDTWDFVDY